MPLDTETPLKTQNMKIPKLPPHIGQPLGLPTLSPSKRMPCLRLGFGLATSIALSLNPISAAPVAAKLDPVIHYELSGGSMSVHLAGNRAYVAASESGIIILDATNPAQLSTIAEVDTPSFAMAVQVVDHLAYVADGEAGLQIIDIADPSAPKKVGEFNPNSFAINIRVVGNIAYLTTGEMGVQILDISNPAAPTKLSEYVVINDRFPTPLSLQIVGTTAYLAYGTLEILDVANPAEPKPLANLGLLNVNDVKVVGNRAYLATGIDGLVVCDVTDPAKPVRLTKNPAPQAAYSVNVAGDLAFTDSGIQDISNPVVPRVVAKTGINVFGNGSPQFIGDYVLYSMGSLEVATVKPRYGTPQHIGWPYAEDRAIPPLSTQPIGMTNSSGLPLNVELLSGPATLSNGQITVTGSGKIRLRFSHPGDGTYLPVDETRTINQPFAALNLVGQYPLTGLTYGVRVKDSLAFVANNDRGLHILDVSNPASPVHVGVFQTTNQSLETEIVSSYAYLADGTNGFRVLDISQPAQPTQVGIAEAGTAIAVRIVGKYAYVLDVGKRFLRTFDISDPSRPTQTEQSQILGDPRNIQVVGTNAYVSAGYGGVLLFDLTDPAHPVRLKTLYQESYVRGLQAIGNTLFIPDYSDESFTSLDISNTDQPKRLGRTTVGGSPRRVQILDNLAFLVAEDAGLMVLDLIDPTQMPVIGRIETGGYARDVQLKDGLIFVADQNEGLKIFKMDPLGLHNSLRIESPSSMAVGSTSSLVGTTDNAGPIKYSVVKGPATLDGNTVKATGLGPVTIRATVDSDGVYQKVSKEFTMIATLPELTLRRSAGSLEAVWPAGINTVQLLSSESAEATASWIQIPTAPVTVDTLSIVPLDTSRPSGFLRLGTLYPGVGLPIEATGWNRDVVLENSADPKATPFGMGGEVWFEEGLNGFSQGLMPEREFTSLQDSTVRFKLQPYTANNVLYLDPENSTNTLVLSTPLALSKLYVLSAYTFSNPNPCTVIAHYTDGTTSAPHTFVSHEWFAATSVGKPVPSAFPSVGRSIAATEFVYGRFANGFSMFQSEIVLNDGQGPGKPVASLEFIRPKSDFLIVGIYTISGVRIPSQP